MCGNVMNEPNIVQSIQETVSPSKIAIPRTRHSFPSRSLVATNRMLAAIEMHFRSKIFERYRDSVTMLTATSKIKFELYLDQKTKDSPAVSKRR
jgi:tRNA (Thr-GGU) A37 N-methylase